MVYDQSNGVRSLASGRETDTIVAVGNSSKILVVAAAAPPYRSEWEDDKAEWSPPEMSLSVDITVPKNNNQQKYSGTTKFPFSHAFFTTVLWVYSVLIHLHTVEHTELFALLKRKFPYISSAG